MVLILLDSNKSGIKPGALQYEAAKPRLLSLAHRMLGSVHDAEDVVQTAWLRTKAAEQGVIENADGWFTTVTVRLCLDQLRARQRRREIPLLARAVAADDVSADEEFLRRENVSRALLLMLDQLVPAQRVAFVLHDLFSMPFDQVAAALDTSPANAKKLASRARIRLRAPLPDLEAAATEQAYQQILDAFLSAARGGDLERLVLLLAPDVVRTVDVDLVPAGTATEVRGAQAVAEETRSFAARVQASIPMIINGRTGAVIAPGGHPLAILSLEIDQGQITRVAITTCRPTDHFLPLLRTDIE